MHTVEDIAVNRLYRRTKSEDSPASRIYLQYTKNTIYFTKS